MESQQSAFTILPGHPYYQSWQKFKCTIFAIYTAAALEGWHKLNSQIVRDGSLMDGHSLLVKNDLVKNGVKIILAKRRLKHVPDLPLSLLQEAFKDEIRAMKTRIENHMAHMDDTSEGGPWRNKLEIYESVAIQLCKQYHEYSLPPLTDEESYQKVVLPASLDAEPIIKRPRIGDWQSQFTCDTESCESSPSLLDPTDTQNSEDATSVDKEDNIDVFPDECLEQYSILSGEGDLPAFDVVFSGQEEHGQQPVIANTSTGPISTDDPVQDAVTSLSGASDTNTSVTHDTVFSACARDGNDSSDDNYDHDDLTSDSRTEPEPLDYEQSLWSSTSLTPVSDDEDDTEILAP